MRVSRVKGRIDSLKIYSKGRRNPGDQVCAGMSINNFLVAYSYLSVSNGSTLVARRAGK